MAHKTGSLDESDICFVLDRGGETSVIYDLAVGLKTYLDLDVDVITWFPEQSVSVHYQLERYSLEATRRTSVNSVIHLYNVLNDYDLVQSHHHFTGALGQTFASLNNQKTVFRLGNIKSGFRFAGRLADVVTQAQSDYVVCNSEPVYQSVPRWEKRLVGKSKFRIIPNGFDPIQVNNFTDDTAPRDLVGIDNSNTITIFTAAALIRQKDIQTLLGSLPQVIQETSQPLELYLAGDGPLKNKLLSLSNSLGISDRVHFVGLLPREDVYQMMKYCDIYCMPSKWEGFSLASLEAMGIGNACIFSDIPQFRKPYGDFALYHTQGDTDDLATQILTLVTDPSKRQKLASEARDYVLKRYHMKSTAQEYFELYESLLAG